MSLRGTAPCGLGGQLWTQPGHILRDQERRRRAGVLGVEEVLRAKRKEDNSLEGGGRSGVMRWRLGRGAGERGGCP